MDITPALAAYGCPVLQVFLTEMQDALNVPHRIRLANLLQQHAPLQAATPEQSAHRARLLADAACRIFVPILMDAVNDRTHLERFTAATELKAGDMRAFQLQCDSLDYRHPDVEGVVAGAASAARQALRPHGQRTAASNAARAIREVIQLAGWPQAEEVFYSLIVRVLVPPVS